MEPVLVVLVAAVGAGLCSAAGVVPLAGRAQPPLAWLGWANATAAGIMLAAAYGLAEAALRTGEALALGGGALVGIGFIWWTHAFSGTSELDLNRLEEADAAYGYEVLLLSALHSGAEGLAIGAAMAFDLLFGLFLALAIGFHNIPEATVLAAVYRGRGVGLGRAAGLAVISEATLVLGAISAFAVLQAAPALLPHALGFGAGALIYLVMVDLLPESYREAGSTSIALVTILAMALVAALQGLFA